MTLKLETGKTVRELEVKHNPLEWVWSSGYDLQRGAFQYDRPGLYESKARFKMVNIGRRGGKTEQVLPLWFAQSLLKPGGIYWWVGNIYKISKKSWRKWLKMRPQDLVVDESKTEMRTELRNGNVYQFMSAENPDSLVSEGLSGVACDEMHLWDEYAWKSCLQPALMDQRGWAFGMFLCRNNFTKKLYKLGQDPLMTAWDSWQMPTYANWSLSPRDIEETCQGMDLLTYKQEVLCQYIDDEGQVFRRVRDRAVSQWEEGPTQGRYYVLSIDWGKRHDFTVATVIDITEKPKKIVAQDRFNIVDYGTQLSRIKRMITTWNPVKVKPEQNGIGDPLIDMLVRDLPGVMIVPVNIQGGRDGGSRARVIERLMYDIETGNLIYPQWEEFMFEAERFTYRTTGSGAVRYEHHKGEQDDCVFSVAFGNDEDEYMEPMIHTF